MATNDELLTQIGKLLEGEREQTRKLVHEEVQGVCEEVQAAKQEIIERIEKEAETTAELFHENGQKWMRPTNE